LYPGWRSVTDRESDFNIGSAKIRIIGKFTEEAALSYRECLGEKNFENLATYRKDLKSIFNSIKYIENGSLQEEREKIKELLEEAKTKMNQMTAETPYHVNEEIFEKLEEADELISRYRLEVNLDLPTSEIKEDNPEDWYE